MRILQKGAVNVKKTNDIKVKRGIRQVILSGFLIILILTQLITSVATYSKASGLIKTNSIEATDEITKQIAISVENYLSTYEPYLLRYMPFEDDSQYGFLFEWCV